jgi:hypothetical protein
MHPLETDSTGNLTPAELARFGGTYTFREKLQLGGTGSSKIIYQEGIPIFDELHRGIENEIAYANFEWLKNGLILRLNINQRLSCVGLTLEEMESINLLAYRIKIRRMHWGILRSKIVHRGDLEIVGTNGLKAKFLITPPFFEGMVRFFSRQELEGRFGYAVSLMPVEEDKDGLLYKLLKILMGEI